MRRTRRSGRAAGAGWKPVVFYGALLAVGALALQWIDYQQLARAHSGNIYTFVVAAGFLALGVYIGARVIGRTQPPAFDGNAKAQAALGISPRELAVLHEIAAGRSNNEIAERLSVSPHTVKTHVARLFDKLDASRRTEAINKARELGIVP
jgi:DNA-binding CsgD family transcriptional regulator